MAAAASSRFAVTCGLLRQFMRDQQQQQQQGAAAFWPPVPVVGEEEEEEEGEKADARTMQLFPPRAGLPEPPSKKPAEAQAMAALTIFYDGRVLVFEDFPADKAKELMQLAASETSPAAPQGPAPAPPVDLPIARKASLQRFLQKRKDRVAASEPYQKKKPVAAPPAEEDVAGKPAPWLGL